MSYFQYHKRIERSTSNGETLIANPENGSDELYYTMSKFKGCGIEVGPAETIALLDLE